MDLTYPGTVRQVLDALDDALAGVSIQEEIEFSQWEPPLWVGERASAEATEVNEPLMQFAQWRKLGAYALPVGELLHRTGRRVAALGWRDATAPWDPSDASLVSFDGSTLRGQVSVAPLCVPTDDLLVLAHQDKEDEVVLVRAERGQTERRGDTLWVRFEQTPAELVSRGSEALASWERRVVQERLGLLGLALGVIDRAWRIALDSLCQGKRDANVLADEQVAQFQLSDIYIERLAAADLALDVAIDAQQGRPFAGKLALARYATSGQAKRCATRALHLSSLFLPRWVPIGRFLVQRAHHLSVFGMAREHEVRIASAGLVAGLHLE
jgi:Acyl-CoA dehydrogenase, C-terminal domain